MTTTATGLDLAPCRGSAMFAVYLPLDGKRHYLGDVAEDLAGRWYAPRCKALVRDLPTKEAAGEALLDVTRAVHCARVRHAIEVGREIGADVNAAIAQAL